MVDLWKTHFTVSKLSIFLNKDKLTKPETSFEEGLQTTINEILIEDNPQKEITTKRKTVSKKDTGY